MLGGKPNRHVLGEAEEYLLMGRELSAHMSDCLLLLHQVRWGLKIIGSLDLVT